MGLGFVPSRPYTLGVELELQLLNATSLELADGILPLMEFFPDDPHVKPEFIQNTVEIATRVCTGVAELEEHLRGLLARLRQRCTVLGMRLCGAGTHPFDRRLALITPLPRYQRIEQESGLISHLQVTFATHVHVGVDSGDRAITLMRRLKCYLPVLIALSANSPYWRGYDTGYASYRHRILAAARSYGIPPSFDDWAAFERFLESTRRAGVFQSVHDIHWDIRPRPHYGTLEVRAMDAQSSIRDAVALAALVQALARLLDGDQPDWALAPLPWWLEKENHFQASRLGLGARFIYHPDGDTRPLAEVAAEAVGAATAGGALDHAPSVERLREMLAGDTGDRRQRRLYEQTGFLPAMLGELATHLET